MHRALLGSVAAVLIGAGLTFAQAPPSPGLLPLLLAPSQTAQPTQPAGPAATPDPTAGGGNRLLVLT